MTTKRTKKDVIEQLQAFGVDKTIGYHYDEELQGLLFELQPNFEYPEWEDFSIQEFINSL